MTHRVDDALVEALRSATRINAPYDADPSCRIVGFILPQAIAWPESGTAIDIPRVLLSAALEAAGVAELREAAADVVRLANNEAVATGDGKLVWGEAVRRLDAALAPPTAKEGSER